MKQNLQIDTNKAPISVLTSIILDTKLHGVDIGNFSIKMNYMRLKKIRKSLIRKPNIDIQFKRDAKFSRARMIGECKVRFYGNDGNCYEIEASISVVYLDVFTNDYYIKNYIYTYLKYMLENIYEVRKLYPVDLEYPEKLFIEDNDIPALQALHVMQAVG